MENEQESRGVWIITAIIGVLGLIAGFIFWEGLGGWVLMGFIPLNWAFVVIGGFTALAGVFLAIVTKPAVAEIDEKGVTEES